MMGEAFKTVFSTPNIPFFQYSKDNSTTSFLVKGDVYVSVF
jgi:hypothetical protein